MAITFLDLINIREFYMKTKNDSEILKLINNRNSQFKDYGKFIEYETRFKNIIKVLFFSDYWNNLVKLKIAPDEFKDEFKNDILILDRTKNKLNYSSDLKYDPSSKEFVEDITNNLLKISLDIVEEIFILYKEHYNIHKISEDEIL